MATELSVKPADPLSLIEAAIAKGVDADKLGRLMDLQERWEKNRAAEAFASAITAFQDECPIILKRQVANVPGRGESKGWSYAFSGYDDIHREIKPLLAKHKIAVTFTGVIPGDRGIQITCRVRVGTHYEDTPLTVPVPQQMAVNDTQKMGAAISFAKRYAICAALNIVTSGEDDDAGGLLENITDEQKQELTGLIESKKVDMKRFLAWAGVTMLDAMPRRNFPIALDMLKRK